MCLFEQGKPSTGQLGQRVMTERSKLNTSVLLHGKWRIIVLPALNVWLKFRTHSNRKMLTHQNIGNRLSPLYLLIEMPSNDLVMETEFLSYSSLISSARID